MKKIFVGYVQGTYGLKGDLKIKSNFDKADRVFTNGSKIYLNNELHEITFCKFYKGFYLCTIDNIKDINEVEKYIGYNMYINREDLHLESNEYLLDDLYGLTILANDKNYGTVKEIFNNKIYNILVIDYDKQFMIPLIDEYVVKIDLENKIIICKNIEELMI